MPDAVNWEKRKVRKLKPDNSRAIKGGEKQVEATGKSFRK